MKNFKRIMTFALIICLLCTQYAIADEKNFSDLDESHWAYESIMKLTEAGFINGYPDGTFRPEGNITRAELIKIVNLVFSYTDKQETTNFTDVKSEDWFYENVLIAEKSGYIVGYPDGTFKPNGLITRQEVCKILDTINNFIEIPYNLTPIDEVSPWAVDYVNKVISNRIMFLDDNNNFRATEKATRAETCDALAKFVLSEEVEEDFNIPSGGGSAGNEEDEMTEEELYETIDRVIRRLKLGVIPELSTDAQEEIVDDIILNMNKYKADNDHDYESAAEETYERFKKMSEEEQEDLKYQIQIQNTTQDLLDLQEFFFPDIEI